MNKAKDAHLISSIKQTKLEKNGSSVKTQVSTKNNKKLENVSKEASTTRKIQFEDVSEQVRTKKKKKSDNLNVSMLNKNLKSRMTLTRQMVDMMLKKAVKQLGKGNGAFSKDIIKYVEENYGMNMGSLETYINKCLVKGVKDGIFEKINEGAAQEKYKLKISKTDNEASQRSLPKRGNLAESVKPTNNDMSKMKNEKSIARKNKDQMLKSDSVEENKKSKVKGAHPLTSEMVMNSIKSLKKRKGAKFEDIQKYIEENCQANMKVQKSHIKKFLKKGVDNGVIEKISEADSEERYKIKKKTEKIRKDSEDRKHGKAAPVTRKSSRNKKTKK